jgi:hypothetical protein
MRQLSLNRPRLAIAAPRSDRYADPSSKLEILLGPDQTHQFMGLFIAHEAQVPICTIRRDCPSCRIENLMEYACYLSLSVGDSLQPELPSMNGLALARRAHMIIVGE